MNDVLRYVVLRLAEARTVLPPGHRMLALADWYGWGGDVPLQWRANTREATAVMRRCDELGILWEVRGVQVGGSVVR